jgi:hypothetical protein
MFCVAAEDRRYSRIVQSKRRKDGYIAFQLLVIVATGENPDRAAALNRLNRNSRYPPKQFLCDAAADAAREKGNHRR